jgi:hypothetical protein
MRVMSRAAEPPRLTDTGRIWMFALVALVCWSCAWSATAFGTTRAATPRAAADVLAFAITNPDTKAVEVVTLPVAGGSPRTVASFPEGTVLLDVRDSHALVQLGGTTIASLDLTDGSLVQVAVPGGTQIGAIGSFNPGATRAVFAASSGPGRVAALEVVDFGARVVRVLGVPEAAIGEPLAWSVGPVLVNGRQLITVDAGSGQPIGQVSLPRDALQRVFTTDFSQLVAARHVSGLGDDALTGSTGLPLSNTLTLIDPVTGAATPLVSSAFHDFDALTLDERGDVLSLDIDETPGSPSATFAIHSRDGSTPLPAPVGRGQILTAVLTAPDEAVVALPEPPPSPPPGAASPGATPKATYATGIVLSDIAAGRPVTVLARLRTVSISSLFLTSA